MEGHFVPNITFGSILAEAVHRITDVPLDVHLMIEDPQAYWRSFKDAGAEMISFHIEALKLPGRLIDEMRKADITVGLALNPETSLDEVLPYIRMVDFILVMTVVPGFGGQKFMKEPLKKVKKLKSMGITVQIDGGIKISNRKDVIESGADILVSGTGIFGEPDPAFAIKRLRGKEN